MSGTAFHKVHYRSAELEAETVPQRAITLEGELRELLASEFGDDCSRREFKVSPDRAEKAMINNFDVLSPGVFIEVIHIDARRSLRFRVREPKPSRNANVLHRRVPDDEDPLGSAAYLLVVGNHVAAIEPFALRFGSIQSYLNALLQAGGRLAPDQAWKLMPKVASNNPIPAGQGVTRIEVRPLARLVGDAPSSLPEKERRRPSGTAESRMLRGGRVQQILEILGANGGDLEALRGGMSADLGLEVKVQVSVRRNYRGSAATLGIADLSRAIASLEEDNVVEVVSPNGRLRGRLTTLSQRVEIAYEAGDLRLDRVYAALSSTLMKWASQAVIDIQFGAG